MSTASSVIIINLVSAAVAGGLTLSSILKFQDGRWVTATVRVGFAMWVLFLAAMAAA